MHWHALDGPIKKTPLATERDRSDVVEKRTKFTDDIQPALDPSKLIFIDESGFRLGAHPRYGWAPIGEDAPGKAPHAWTHMNIIGAMALDGFRSVISIDAATSGEVFREFVRHELVPNLKSGEIVVMDNLSSHQDAIAIQLIRDAGADVLFLPPYSPEYNPIEKAWAKLKDLLRKQLTRTRDTFEKALASAIDAISCDNILSWTLHAGYLNHVRTDAV